jgi:hypothetical protein
MKDRISIQIRKHWDFYLWDKDFNKWTDKDREDFYKLEASETKPVTIEKVKRHTTKPKKIQRILDGKIYNSLHECMRDNNITGTVLYGYISTNLYYTLL